LLSVAAEASCFGSLLARAQSDNRISISIEQTAHRKLLTIAHTPPKNADILCSSRWHHISQAQFGHP
jgi:hypothetical protein